MKDRYQLFSVQYARAMWMSPVRPIRVAAKLADLGDHLSNAAAHGFKDWYVKDAKMDKYVDPEIVKKLTGVTWIEGDGYPRCPCCDSMGASHADHTFLPNCLAKKA